MITMAPRPEYSSITPNMRSWLGMSRPVTGSSSMITSGSPASTWAILTLCCWPPLSSPKLRFENWFTSSCSPATRIAARSSPLRRPSSPRLPYRPMASTSPAVIGIQQDGRCWHT